MTVETHDVTEIPGLFRVETTTKEAGLAQVVDLTRSVYPHDAVYGRYCSIQDHIDCPPRDVFGYLADIYSLEEWTASLRGFRPAGRPGLYVAWDRLAAQTEIYCRVEASAEAMTVDYHCAWDQGDELWMIYLMRVVPAELVLGRPGSVVLWTNCRHPYYESNPYPERVPHEGRPWVGEFWDQFYAGHTLELRNLKTILEYRHSRGLPLAPARAATVDATADGVDAGAAS